MRSRPPSWVRSLGIAAACAGLAACATILGGIPFCAPGEAETNVTLAPGEVFFWTQFSASYRGDMSATFDVEVSQQGQVVGRSLCDPVHPLRICTVRYNGIDDHSWNCKMPCSAYLLRGGPTRVRARFTVNGGPPGFRVNEANLMIRQ